MLLSGLKDINDRIPPDHITALENVFSHAVDDLDAKILEESQILAETDRVRKENETLQKMLLQRRKENAFCKEK